jgi:hypothetical protein
MPGIAPTLDARSVATLSDAEIDAFVRRIAECLTRLTTPVDFDVFVFRIEELLDRVDQSKKGSRKR